jgi:predicted transcriptional regulator
MGANKTKVTGFRIEDESILKKLNTIAKNNCRTRNKEVEYALKQYVEQYERLNGRIEIEE